MVDFKPKQDFVVNEVTDYSDEIKLSPALLDRDNQVTEKATNPSYKVYLGSKPRTWRGFWIYVQFMLLIGIASQVVNAVSEGDWHRLAEPGFYGAMIFSLVVMFVVVGLMYLYAPSFPFSRKNLIELSSDGLDFSKSSFGTLMGRYIRSWDDVHSILVTELSNWDIVHWERRAQGKTVFGINFVSGGNMWLWLENLSAPEATKLFEAIEAYADPTTLNADAVRLKQFLLLGSAAAEDLSYTSLADLDAQYATTNFGLLPPNYFLQNGRYRIVTQISGGGLSAVYLAKTEFDQRVVIKETALPPDLNESVRNKTEELIEREANILSKLVHPNIAKVLDYFVERKRNYIVLEYVSGSTLRQLVLNKGPMQSSLVLNIGEQLADVLIFLHSQNPPIIHRDISPDNIILHQEKRAVLIDFGAANEFIEGATGTIIGKQSYMAPEQVRGKAEPLSDIYSLGATLYFLLTGKDPVPLSQVRPGEVSNKIPAELDSLIAACTAQELSNRPKSAEVVFDQLKLSRTDK